MNSDLVAAYRALDPSSPNAVPGGDDELIRTMSKAEAAMTIARYHAQRIADADTQPYDGAKAIVWEACHSLDSTPSELKVFVALEAEYADFSDQTRTDYYGDEHCKSVRESVEKKIVEAAMRLIDSE